MEQYTKEILDKAWKQYVSEEIDQEEGLGYGDKLDLGEIYKRNDSDEDVKYITFNKYHFYKWIADRMLCVMCNNWVRYNEKTTILDRHWEDLITRKRLCFYSGHPHDTSINDAELTVSQVAYIYRRSNGWVLSLIKYGILKAECFLNMYIIRKKDIGNMEDMKAQLKIAIKDKRARQTYLNSAKHKYNMALPENQFSCMDFYKSLHTDDKELIANELMVINKTEQKQPLEKPITRQSQTESVIPQLQPIDSYEINILKAMESVLREHNNHMPTKSLKHKNVHKQIIVERLKIPMEELEIILKRLKNGGWIWVRWQKIGWSNFRLREMFCKEHYKNNKQESSLLTDCKAVNF